MNNYEVTPPEREQYKCPKCGIIVSGIYILVASKKCPICNTELQHIETKEGIIGYYYQPKIKPE